MIAFCLMEKGLTCWVKSGSTDPLAERGGFHCT